MKFGERIRSARLSACYSQQQLANKTGLCLRTIQNYESGARLPKQRDTYCLLARALHIDHTVLMDDAGVL
jgi:transcriptional regulator with XRE-family HTH domain